MNLFKNLRSVYGSLFILSVLLYGPCCYVKGTGGSPQQQSSYVSVAALNEYGQSVQLKNALCSSVKHGNLVVVASCENPASVVVCSIGRKQPGIINLNPRVVQVLSKSDDGDFSSSQSCCAIVCSGFKPDAILMIRLLREYARRNWEFYDEVSTCERMANAASSICLKFMGYGDDEEISDNAGLPIIDEDFNMARPFGVSSLVIEVQRVGPGIGRASIISVDPSGIQEAWIANALGRGSEEARKKLEIQWKPKLSLEETKEMCRKIVCDAFGEIERQDDCEIVCEVLSEAGSTIESSIISSFQRH
mmetsp:Transcript_14854/g.19368  ORF Transcript_14854/g.19368 Transcript_14854/m.19368 type:complete len:305 (-) Transcript_14854:147-1061(-)|eukprot:CAMPEP_0116055608 /NCGR_PEP_ID=MMETSP0322-20121206/3511_1 /TAXON_ID=163516 /ORGANISM="Leptocylindrus danicus var. apora, Strain B651" /LENGTH=304 /DNA_ID=CAMNT_0003539249 /DNA_START=104 /DNA_END=1018 /DNA_ORIENTATION=-